MDFSDVISDFAPKNDVNAKSHKYKTANLTNMLLVFQVIAFMNISKFAIGASFSYLQT
jgi:hypothetical protein